MSRWKATARWMSVPLIVGGIIFSAAGRLDLPMVWGVVAAATLFHLAASFVVHPGLMAERQRPGPGNRDRLTRPVAAGLLLAHWVVAGLDVGRFGWSVIPTEWQFVGLVGYAVALVGVFWALRANPFYSSAVRIQADRGHRVVETGPYRFVRHPGYTGTILAMLCGGIALGSWAGMVPVVGVIALFLRRTTVEDRFLRRELPGYADYARRVRYRLVAGAF
jgi:protein-S-isoprenylcysteine O-methyltransferase Ste14